MPRIITLIANCFSRRPSDGIAGVTDPCAIYTGDTIQGCPIVSASVLHTKATPELIERGYLAGWYPVYRTSLVVIAPDDIDSETLTGELGAMYTVGHMAIQVAAVAWDSAVRDGRFSRPGDNEAWTQTMGKEL